MIRKKDKSNLIFTPNAGVLFSVILLLLSVVFSLCIGQKQYDVDEIGFSISFFLPGVFGLLAIADAGIEYIDGKKGSMWSTIVSIVISLIQSGFALYAGVAYFTKYPQVEAGNTYKIIAFTALIALLILNLFARNVSFFKTLKEITGKIPLIISGFFLASVVACSFAMASYDINDLAYAEVDKLFTLMSFYASIVFAIMSLILTFIQDQDKVRDYGLTGILFVAFVLNAIALITRVYISPFTKMTFYVDYWQLVSLGYSAISMAFPIGYMGYLLSKKKEG
ncbi:MAG: hypothetical protein MJ238_01870 [Bacilli bacterium]|nr:hypothetical protein [Bacilli bacterium]